MRVRGISLITGLALALSACATPQPARPADAALAGTARGPMGPGLTGRFGPGAAAGQFGSALRSLLALAPTAGVLPDAVRRGLNLALARVQRHHPGRFAVAVYDRTTSTRYAFRERTPFMLASVAKVDILLALLLLAQRERRALTADERQLAGRMIRYSDNDCAHRLYQAVGGQSGLTRALRRLGVDSTWPGSGTYWGATRSKPSDQVKVLQRLTDPGGPVSARNRRFALGLMATVTHAQAWGVSAAAAGGTVALKNGWLPARVHDGLWTVNSIGRLRTAGHDLLLAVLSERSPGMEQGIGLVERVARVAVGAFTRDASAL